MQILLDFAMPSSSGPGQIEEVADHRSSCTYIIVAWQMDYQFFYGWVRMQTNHTPDTNKLCLFARAFLLISYYFPLLLICWSNVWIQHAATCRDLNYPAGISSNAWHAAPFLYASSFVLSSSLIRILDQPVRTIEHQLYISPNLTKRVKYFGHDKKKVSLLLS